ncbi:MAG: hypothetical protein E2O29_01885 [Deltaproteobacteria bacterium]|nr:MAG: hypothetical protein E2O29_01885 [Deltaproteobacteria bacterium]
MRMLLLVMLIVSFLLLGCTDKRMRIISDDIPLNMYDLEEIRSGVDQSKQFKKDVVFIEDEIINDYVTKVGKDIARISERPHLPWQFFVIKEPRVEAFAFPGGYIYISTGLFSFIDSKAELAAVLAHEIGHTTALRYQSGKKGKKFKINKIAKIGLSATGGYLGSAAGAASGMLSGFEVSSPYIKQQFSKSAEVEADGRAMNYLSKLGYPAEAVIKYNEKLATIPIDKLPDFIHFFSAHPPSQFRVYEAKENFNRFMEVSESNKWGKEYHRVRVDYLYYEVQGHGGEIHVQDNLS